VDDRHRIAELCAYLRERVVDVELQAAHHREFIPDGHQAPEPVRHALSAAVFAGYAQALRHVLEELEG
jgi:hypothetical protein